MSKEKKTVELNDEELDKVTGGRHGRPGSGTCPRGKTWCGYSDCTQPSWCEHLYTSYIEGMPDNLCDLGVDGGFILPNGDNV